MKVHLAGYNVDTEILRELQEAAGARPAATPEVISAAYARISRDPRSIDQIRRDARVEVEKSRRSNSTIIFKMGHHSVAEHAVFNLDVLGVSRFAVEQAERFRLCSYTEKSQRYVTLDSGFVIPGEIEGTPLKDSFIDIVNTQNRAYFRFFDKLKEYVFGKYPDLAKDPAKRILLEGWAKEDARYITPLCAKAQFGLTVNARNLELMLRRFASHPLQEVKELGRQMYAQIAKIAPSIVIFHNANDYDQKTYPELKKTSSSLITEEPDIGGPAVQLVEVTGEGDEIVAAALLHTSSGLPFRQCRSIVKKLTFAQKRDIFKTACANMQFYDSLPREFEYADLTYDITLSAACFGQLKRHRMSTITVQDYNLSLGVTVPESIRECGMESEFMEIIGRTNEAYGKIALSLPEAAPYVLTNAHRRRVIMKVNARELYHISRLREDAHAQWDIRRIVSAMSVQAKKIMPLVFALIGGKDSYPQIYEEVYGCPPKVTSSQLPGVRRIE